MRQKTERHQEAADRTIKGIRRQTRRKYTAEDKIRIVLSGLKGEDSIAELCRREAPRALEIEDRHSVACHLHNPDRAQAMAGNL